MDGEGEHALQALDEIYPPGAIGLANDFGIAAGKEAITLGFKLAAQLDVVINAAIEHHRQAQISIDHRLFSALGKIENLQPAMAQNDMAAGADPFPIRASRRQRIIHCDDRRRVGAATIKRRFSTDSTHSSLRVVEIDIVRIILISLLMICFNPKKAMSQIEDRVLRAMRRLVHAADSHSKRMERSAGITTPQLVVLKTLQEGGRMSVNQLAAAVSLSAPTLVPILDKLELRRLIERQRGTLDRRNVFVEVTEAGQAAIKTAPTALDRHFVERFALLPVQRQETLVGALEEIVALMGPVLAPERILAEPPPVSARDQTDAR